jgi:pSer/pThr/pTyr-binding forkhead associated (FHA) protein
MKDEPAAEETIRVNRPTLVDIPIAAFSRPETRLRVIGVLSPVVGVAASRFTINAPEFIIGRDVRCDAYIADDSVSRQHARILRKEDAFILEDLGSINGTFLDGVPILSCTLRDGDAIQIGHNLFYFDRLLELINQGEGSPGSSLNLPFTPINS